MLQIRVAFWRVPWEPMKIGERDFAFTIWSVHAHDRIERSKRDAHVARVRRDALLAVAKNCVNAIVTLERAAAAAGLAFIARWKCGVIKIVTSRSLEKIATDGRHVAQLRTRAGKKRLTQHRVARFD